MGTFVISLHVETKEGRTRSRLDQVLLKLVKLVTYFRIFIKKANFAVAHLDKAHLEAYLSDSQREVGLLGDVADKGITSGSGAEDDL